METEIAHRPVLRLVRTKRGRLAEALASEDRYAAEADARKLMINIGEQLQALICCGGQTLGDHFIDAVDLAMFVLHEGLSSYDLIPPKEINLSEWSWDVEILKKIIESRNGRSWREIWEDGPSELPLEENASQLVRYAYYGLPTMFRSEDLNKMEDPAVLIEATETVLRTCAPGMSNTPTLTRVLLAAQGRLAIDQGRNVTPEQLAALARIGNKSMRNALAPSSGAGLKMSEGGITAESALNWLRAHGKYETTLGLRNEASTEPPAEPLAGEVLFVPFATDDIEFDPVKCRRDGKYTVGPKGAEQTFVDYRAALDCLARMQPASYWKHPNTANNWGTVAAVGFRPRTPVELGLEPAEGGEK